MQFCTTDAMASPVRERWPDCFVSCRSSELGLDKPESERAGEGGDEESAAEPEADADADDDEDDEEDSDVEDEVEK